MDENVINLSRACDPTEVLQPGDPRYVNCDAARGQAVVRKYARSIMAARPDRPDVKFFAGHMGIGKSCELLRLQKELQGGGFFVIYIDVAERLDLNDIGFPDLLALIASEVQEHTLTGGLIAVTQKLKNSWDELKNLLGSTVNIKEAEVDTGFGKVALELQKNPSKRMIIRESIERIGTQLLDAINDHLDEAVIAVRKRNQKGLVLIVDGLEKIHLRVVDDHGTTTHDRFFVDRCTQLTSLHAHCIYTIPISLVYSPRHTFLQQTIGDFSTPLPMIRLRGPNKSDITNDTDGMKAIAQIVAARCDFAKVTPELAFEKGVIEYLCRMSGGHPRHLMAFIQAACNEIDSLPITTAAAKAAVRQYANSLFYQQPDDAQYLSKLKVFDTPRRDIPRDAIHRDMLYLLHVFQYMNDQPYYEVNPVFREIPSYVDAKPA